MEEDLTGPRSRALMASGVFPVSCGFREAPPEPAEVPLVLRMDYTPITLFLKKNAHRR